MAAAVVSLSDHARLVAGLQRTLAPQGEVRRIETHISTVLLAGAHAYKLKKPVALGFLDFSTLDARLRACEDELRLDQRTAPQLYRAVLWVSGTPDAPVLYEQRPADGVIDVALLMQRFDTSQVLDELALRHALPVEAMAPLGRAVAHLHARADAAPAGSDFGAVSTVRAWTQRTVESLREHTLAPADRARVDALATWCAHDLQRHATLIEARRAAGRVRECHGDLHLGNIVLLDGVAVPFDALEFNAELRFIDVTSDVAFLWMDLLDHGLPAHAARVLDAWLEDSGDADALRLLRGCAVYRALVRAYVAQLRAQQPGTAVAGRVREHTSFAHYLALAERLRVSQPAVVVMTGLSGAGKSTIAARLAERLGGIRVRSDVERKRLAGLDWRDRAAPSSDLYSAVMTERTYARLHEVVRAAVAGGVPVVVDAASLRASERGALLALADALHAPAVIVECTAAVAVLRERIAQRVAHAADPSDATVHVLEAQLQWREPPTADEAARLIQVDTAAPAETQRAACDAVIARLRR